MLETLDFTIRIGSTPTFLYFDLYLYSAYAEHYVYYNYLLMLNAGSYFNITRFLPQKYFYSLVIGVKLNMAICGYTMNELNQSKPQV